MTYTESERFEKLTIALQYDSYGEKYLTAFERILIHQERSALINSRVFELPQTIEEKIKTKLIFIKSKNWESPEL
ncbi:hypothetical protein [Chryseobacterium scophthalmum]|uniref:hypothetical protein n=1 Tax=Chryseobacterium scophthalmum TaxID=59733 RepID=UPI000C9DD9AE|nr:hypothetical protein [Chryseobacterium scophthalmum]